MYKLRATSTYVVSHQPITMTTPSESAVDADTPGYTTHPVFGHLRPPPGIQTGVHAVESAISGGPATVTASEREHSSTRETNEQAVPVAPPSTGAEREQTEEESMLSYAAIVDAAGEAFAHLQKGVGSAPNRLPTIMTTVLHLATLNTPMQVITYLLDKVISECEPAIVQFVRSCMDIDGVTVTPQALGFEVLGKSVLKLSAAYEQFKTHAAWQRLARVLVASIAGLFVATKMVSTRHVSSLVKGLTGLVSVNTLLGGNLFEDALYVVKTIVTALSSGAGIFEGFGDPERNTLELRFAHALSMKEVFISQDWTLAAERNAASDAAIKDFPVDDATFYGLLDHLCRDLQLKIATVDTKKTSADLYFYTRALAQASALRFQVSDAVKRSGFKPAAYALSLLGNSGIGKSVLVELITSTLLKSLGHQDVKRLICNVNSGDKYFSGLHNGHKAVIIDDAVARSGLTGIDAGAELEVVRNFVGNQPIPLVSAALEDKGRIMPFVDIVSLTTNVEDLHAHITANCPYSALRRVLAHIEVNTKREYWRMEGSGNTRVAVPNTLSKQRAGVINTDVYTFTVKRVIEDRGGKTNGYAASGVFVVQEKDGHKLENITWTQLIKYLVSEVQAHVEDQRGKVTTMKDFFNTPLCPHFVPQGTCDDCKTSDVQQVTPAARTGVEQTEEQSAAHAHFMGYLTSCGFMKDIARMSSPWSMIDPLGELCATEFYKRECQLPLESIPKGWLVKAILRRAWFKSLLGSIFAIIHGVLSALTWALVFFVLYGPTFAFVATATVTSGVFFTALAVTLPFTGVFITTLMCAFAVVVFIIQTTIIVPLSCVVAIIVLMLLTGVRALIAQRFIRVMVLLSHLNSTDAARLQGGSIFTVNMTYLSGLSALVCMFFTGRLIYKMTRSKETEVTPAGLFYSKPPEGATEYIPEGPQVLPSLPVAPTERTFETTCNPPKNLTTLQDTWKRQDHYQRFPPPPEHLATTTRSVIERKLESSVYRIELRADDDSTVTQTGLFITTNFFVMNAHGLYRDNQRRRFKSYRVFRDDLSKASGRLDDIFWERIPRHVTEPKETTPDLVLLYLPSAPSCRDLRDMFVDAHPKETSAYVFGLDNDSKAYTFRTRATRSVYKTSNLGTFTGYSYRCTTPLLGGYCGHPMVDLSNKIILGIHCASVNGTDDKYLGAAIYATPMLTTMEILSERCKVLRPLEAANTPAYGVTPASLSYGPVSNNSVLLQDPEAIVSVLPSIKGYQIPRARAAFVRSRAADVLESMGLSCKHFPSEDYGKFRVDKDKIASTKSQAHIPAQVILDAAEICHEEDRAVFKHVQRDALGLLSIDDAINGAGGLGPIPRSTSAGFPYKGKKRDYLIEMTRPDGTIFYSANAALEKEVRTVWSTLASGQRINAVYKASHKAELVKPGKSTRIFEGIPLPLYITMRMVFGSLYAVYSAYALQLCTVGGINPFGRDWHYIYEWMSVLTSEIAGDYKKFDYSNEAFEKHVTFYYMLRLMAEFGNYDQESLDVASACAFEHIYHIALFRGDLGEFYGVTSSGCLLTLIIGNRVNRGRLVAAAIVLFRRHGSCEEMYTRPPMEMPVVTTAGYTLPADYRSHIGAYCKSRGLPSVFDYMILLTMGDDFRIRVDSHRTPFLNQRAIQALFLEWDIVITDSHKNPVFEYLFTPEDEIDFLKRADRWDDELEIVRGPLLLSSIFKPYFFYQPSTAVTEDLYLAGLIPVTEMELHMHGRDVYFAHHMYLEALVNALNLGNFLSQDLRNYDEVTSYWKRKYSNTFEPVVDEIICVEITPQATEYCSYCYTSHNVSAGAEQSRAFWLLLRFRHLYNLRNYQRSALEEVCRQLECIFMRHNGLEQTVAARYPLEYEHWANNSYQR